MTTHTELALEASARSPRVFSVPCVAVTALCLCCGTASVVGWFLEGGVVDGCSRLTGLESFFPSAPGFRIALSTNWETLPLRTDLAFGVVQRIARWWVEWLMQAITHCGRTPTKDSAIKGLLGLAIFFGYWLLYRNDLWLWLVVISKI